MNNLPTLLKREYWENKGGFFYTPIIIGSFLLLTLLFGLFNTDHLIETHADELGPFNLRGIEISGMVGMEFLGDLSKEFAKLSLERRQEVWDLTFYGLSSSFSVVLLILSLNYLLGCLYDDRKDRSILFWKSLPVSDLMTVTSKVLTALVVLPLLFTLASAVTFLGFLLISTVAALIAGTGGSIWAAIWEPAPLITGPLNLFANYFMQGLWAAPFLGWLLLVSSWTKRKPILMATIPLGIIMFLEAYYYRTTRFADLVLERLYGWLAPVDFETSRHLVTGDLISNQVEMYAQPMAFFGVAELWYGLALAAIFFAGAVFIRRYRDES